VAESGDSTAADDGKAGSGAGSGRPQRGAGEEGSEAGDRPAPPEAEDPFLWLEEVEGERALAWVAAENERALAALGGTSTFAPLFERILNILDSPERIPFPRLLEGRIYNFWQDPEHPRGIWRRADAEGFLSGAPRWEVVIDVDRLAAEEGVPWSLSEVTCFEPSCRRCLVHLSRGGADAVELREMDLETRTFLDSGFRLPEAKQSAGWVDEDTLLVASVLGGSPTGSGYPRVARLWRRGESLSAAPTVFEAAGSDVGIWAGTLYSNGRILPYVWHRPAFFDHSIHLWTGAALERLDLPLDADPSIVGDRLVVYVRSDWAVGGHSFPAGSLIHTSFGEFLAGERSFEPLLEPGERQTIRRTRETANHLLVELLDNVRGQLRRYRYQGGGWRHEVLPLPPLGSVGEVATSPWTDRCFFTYSGFTQPTTLYLAEEDGKLREVQRLPDLFDAADLSVSQHEATSADGTRVPYFMVGREGQTGRAGPTLLYAYGGFENPLTPAYAGVLGASWLERGGTYVLANIRGGGEFGPAWHRSAQRENRERAFEDFFAVAEALIGRGVTTPQRLGIMGGSNGGLLMGVALTRRPELFGAVVIQVPLLDMRRYHRLLAGASWVAEYGDPDDPADWAFIARYSPYQNVRPGMPYPRVLFTSTTRDDRVHPGHGRKMAALLDSMGYPMLYFESTEGGHGAGVTNEQRARVLALTFAFLWEELGGG
jgi:prolyl oligopeptidase